MISLASRMSERTDNTRVVASAMVNLNCQLLEDYKYEKNEESSRRRNIKIKTQNWCSRQTIAHY